MNIFWYMSVIYLVINIICIEFKGYVYSINLYFISYFNFFLFLINFWKLLLFICVFIGIFYLVIIWCYYICCSIMFILMWRGIKF